jgi:hypothetical protein
MRADWATAPLTSRIWSTRNDDVASAASETGDKPKSHSRSFPTAIPQCAHDGEHYPISESYAHICDIHYQQWMKWLRTSGKDRDRNALLEWSAAAADDD